MELLGHRKRVWVEATGEAGQGDSGLLLVHSGPQCGDPGSSVWALLLCVHVFYHWPGALGTCFPAPLLQLEGLPVPGMSSRTSSSSPRVSGALGTSDLLWSS